VLAAFEWERDNGPWVSPNGKDKFNGVVRYTQGNARNGLSLTFLGFSNHWHSTDQIPQRAVDEGLIDRFGFIEETDGAGSFAATEEIGAQIAKSNTGQNKQFRVTAERPGVHHEGVADRAAYGPHVGIFTTETRFWSSRPLWFLIWSGVFERFPRLRFGVAECGAFWVNDLLWRMDLVYDRDHGSRKLGSQLTAQMTVRPSEYFDRNCFIGASNIVRVEMARRYEIGVHNLCWGNDFPHPEGTWPHTREFLAAVFRDIPRDETAAMLGTNAAEVYGFW